MAINQLLCNFRQHTNFTVPTSNQGAVTFTVGGPPGGTGPLPIVTQQVFVAAVWGSDTTGNGTDTNPYATLLHALASITDASVTKSYEVFLAGGSYVGDVAIPAFVSVIGTEQNNVSITGTLSLGASFADPYVGQTATISTLNVLGNITFDYSALPSSGGSVTFDNIILNGDVNLAATPSSDTVFSNCLLFGNYSQTGGQGVWLNTNGLIDSALFVLKGPAFFWASGGAWAGSVTLDQNAQPDQVILKSDGFSMSKGNVQIVASGTQCPTITSAFGDLPENCVIGGGAAAVMSPQMRVSHEFVDIAPNPTAIAATGTTTLSLPYPSGLFGATPIETMQMNASLAGANWGTFIGAHNCSVTVTWRTNAGVPTCDVNIYNPGLAFNITEPINLNTSGYLPQVL